MKGINIMRINELNAVSEVSKNDFVVVDTVNGTKKASVSQLFNGMIVKEEKQVEIPIVGSNTQLDAVTLNIEKDGYTAIGAVGVKQLNIFGSSIVVLCEMVRLFLLHLLYDIH